MNYDSISNIESENNQQNSNDSAKQFEISLRYNENEQQWERIEEEDENIIKFCYKVYKVKSKTFEIYKTLELVSKPFLALAIILLIIFFMSRSELFLPTKNG
jgi:Fe2+ transport system protein B